MQWTCTSASCATSWGPLWCPGRGLHPAQLKAGWTHDKAKSGAGRRHPRDRQQAVLSKSHRLSAAGSGHPAGFRGRQLGLEGAGGCRGADPRLLYEPEHQDHPLHAGPAGGHGRDGGPLEPGEPDAEGPGMSDRPVGRHQCLSPESAGQPARRQQGAGGPDTGHQRHAGAHRSGLSGAGPVRL